MAPISTAAAGLFSDYLEDIIKKHPKWEDKHVLKDAAVAYNSGVKNGQAIGKMDKVAQPATITTLMSSPGPDIISNIRISLYSGPDGESS